MRSALLCLAMAGCGRIDFAARPDSTIDTSVDSHVAVCGDGVCDGQLGELCATCNDCKTLSVVCGNGACEAGELGTCYADCGPSPWPWQTEADQLLTALNQARATGVTCPGAGGPMTAPPLVYDAVIEPTAREWAWEAAHETWYPSDACNGRTGFDRVTAAGLASAWKVFDATSPADAINMLLVDASACPNVMSSSVTEFAGAAAHDAITSHAVVFR